MKGKRSILIRVFGLLAIIAGAALLLLPPLEQKRLEKRIRVTLLEVQTALQEYHVEEELYPRKMMTGSELVSLLAENDFLEKDVLNPWTKDVYSKSEGRDYLSYKTDSLAETYELIVYYPGTEKEQFRLDSTENQSLEE